MHSGLRGGVFALAVLAVNLGAGPMTLERAAPSVRPTAGAPSESRPASAPATVRDAPEPTTYLLVGIGLVLVSVGGARLRRRPSA